ncbi:hypothetical protein HU200_019873 [Digitaria exilis]|uniref:Pentatricopeptide repeat-containing protein n=1 Tax=Digitaria exilis TaxID=1010633 RepID=A0A835KG47_9POAL|nr:hypothetical protein HU200_019873 [Digitaria exilis]
MPIHGVLRRRPFTTPIFSLPDCLPPIPPTKPFPARCPPRAQLVGAASTPRTSQAELRPDSKNASLTVRRDPPPRARGAAPFRAPPSRPPLPPWRPGHLLRPSLRSSRACRSLKHARQVHAHLRIHGLDTNEFLLARLVELYLTLAPADDARGAVDGHGYRHARDAHQERVRRCTGMLMTGLMDVYFKCGEVKLAVRVFEEMPKRTSWRGGRPLLDSLTKG